MFPLMDRMGNVTGYRKAVSGTAATLSAVFEYDAFGREVRSSGPASDAMRFRFSTKYHHGGPYTETDAGLVYYGYRFCAPSKAWHFWPGESPGKSSPLGGSLEGARPSQSTLSSLAAM
jgi:hypothetical protein